MKQLFVLLAATIISSGCLAQNNRVSYKEAGKLGPNKGRRYVENGDLMKFTGTYLSQITEGRFKINFKIKEITVPYGTGTLTTQVLDGHVEVLKNEQWVSANIGSQLYGGSTSVHDKPHIVVFQIFIPQGGGPTYFDLMYVNGETLKLVKSTRGRKLTQKDKQVFVLPESLVLKKQG